MVPPQFPQGNSRRHFLQGAGLATAAAVLGTRSRAESTPRAVVEEVRTISLQPQYYHGWPTVTRRRNGDLVLVVSGGREGHICPFGRVEMMVSHDQGATWNWPQTILDSPSDDRDAGVLETARGTLLATTFTSLAYERSLLDAEKKKGQPGAWPEERLQRWQAAYTRLNAEERKANLGEWMVRSTDGGITWSARYPTLVNSPHGPTQLADGRLLYVGKQLWTTEQKAGVGESTDDGATWKWLADIPVRAGDSVTQYHELHAVEAGGGRVIAQIRNHNKTNSGETLQTESTDGGKSWTEPHSIGVWGLPSFLNRLRDGRLLMTYGHRRAPFGNQARVSTDAGRTWSEPLLIYGDGTSGDLGYPSTVEFDDSSLLTVWYEHMKDTPYAVLRQARWKITT
ncbi:MAG: exo-alpha-sialidase [Chthoniobacter sp.]|uniref:exo-alpha-sialidase n=1 Tax=Chthoniobacter sp. TaxID=2510640 RepID=UPI0032A3D016